jgi:hypothetical protein
MTDTVIDTSPAADPVAEAIRRALEAAQLATDAAHEAEAVILARSEASAAMAHSAKRSTMLAAVVGGAALISLLAGTAIWWRATADLRDAGAVQAEAAAAFVTRLTEMNSSLDRMDATQLAFATDEAGLAARLDRIEQMLAARLPTLAAPGPAGLTPPAPDTFEMRIEALRDDILAAITEAELSMAERMVQLAASAAPVAPATASAGTSATPAITPRPSPVAAPRPVARPDAAPRAAPPAQPNPFRYP